MGIKYRNPGLYGIINVYKEKGMTSHDVVAAVRKATGAKVGHAGTLDPDAEGVLVVLLGKCTKLSDKIMLGEKRYRAVCVLGIETDTQDASGEVIKTCPVTCTPGDIERAILRFEGGYMQIPPMYSALKVNGRKLYELARTGKTVERAHRFARIDAIKILTYHPEPDNALNIDVKCGKGVYIRTLCADIGAELGCGAHMSELIRLSVGNFTSDKSVKLNRIRELAAEDRLKEIIIREYEDEI